MAEGIELVATAISSGVPIEAVYLAVEHAGRPEVQALRHGAVRAGLRVHELAPGVLDRVAGTVTPQPVLAVLPLPAQDLSHLEGVTMAVVGVDLRDPGNAGTVLRCADASGVDVVAFCGATVDPYNPKAVRASAGSIFHLPVVVWPSWSQVLERLGAGGIRRLGTASHGGQDYAGVDWRVPSAVVLGNEAHGLSPEVLASLDATVSVPMEGRAESLNVAMSCAVVCFEALRQRRLGQGRGSLVVPQPGPGRAGPETTRPTMPPMSSEAP